MVVHLEARHAFLVPLRQWFTHEEVVEELFHPDRVILLIGSLRQAVVFARILEQDDRFLHPAKGVEVFHSLREIDGTILVIVKH
jgi:hypothetical protein